MKKLNLSDGQFETVMGAVATDINRTQYLLRKKMNENTKIHLEARLTKLQSMLEYLNSVKNDGDSNV